MGEFKTLQISLGPLKGKNKTGWIQSCIQYAKKKVPTVDKDRRFCWRKCRKGYKSSPVYYVLNCTLLNPCQCHYALLSKLLTTVFSNSDDVYFLLKFTYWGDPSLVQNFLTAKNVFFKYSCIYIILLCWVHYNFTAVSHLLCASVIFCWLWAIYLKLDKVCFLLCFCFTLYIEDKLESCNLSITRPLYRILRIFHVGEILEKMTLRRCVKFSLSPIFAISRTLNEDV